MADPATGKPSSVWHLRALEDDGSPAWVAVVASDRHPDRADVDRPVDVAWAETEGGLVGGVARLDADGAVARIEVLPHRTELPPLWFVEVPETDQELATTSLVAFTGGTVEPGTLLDVTQAQKSRVRTADQVGAFRWYPHSGLGEQLYVAPAWRLRRIGTALLSAAGVLTLARGLTPLWGSGQRTAEGDRMRQAGVWAHRSEELTHLLPPMTPMDERDAAPRPPRR